jgi:hypothetical protein
VTDTTGTGHARELGKRPVPLHDLYGNWTIQAKSRRELDSPREPVPVYVCEGNWALEEGRMTYGGAITAPNFGAPHPESAPSPPDGQGVVKGG